MKKNLTKIMLASSFLIVASDLAVGRGCPDSWAKCTDGTPVMINYSQKHGIFSDCTPIAQGSGQSIKQAIAKCTNENHGGFDLSSVPDTSLDVTKKIVSGIKTAGEIIVVTGKIAIEVLTVAQGVKDVAGPLVAGK